MDKLLVITGPTATGKTALGIELAKRFNGEIISADSRQVYKGNDVETGKDLSFPQWGIDLVGPGQEFSASHFVKYAREKITDIANRGKLPIIVGGTGQYIKELLSPSETLHISLDPKLRERLVNCSVAQLQEKLEKADKDKWQQMNESDRHNPRRLIRAIEVTAQGTRHRVQGTVKYNLLMIGLTATRQVLYDRIRERRRNRPDLIAKEFSLAKKQLTYMQKFLRPVWFDITAPGYQDKILAAVKKWYTSTNGGKKA